MRRRGRPDSCRGRRDRRGPVPVQSSRVTGSRVEMEFHLFLPQMRMTPAALVERARAAEAAGFRGMALMDHLAPPQAADQPMFEAMTTATWLAAHTERL